MKKEYINPKLCIVKIETAKMIALSGILDTTQTIENSDEFGAREYDFDEDEY